MKLSQEDQDDFNKFLAPSNLKLAANFYIQSNISKQNSLPIFSELEKDFVNKFGEKLFSVLSNDLSNYSYYPDLATYYFVPKKNAALRPMAVLSLTDAVTYQALFNWNVLGSKIEKQLHSTCYANRISGKQKYFFKRYQDRFDKFINVQIKAFNKGFKHKIELDVQQFFHSINHDLLISLLKNRFDVTNPAFLSILKNQLQKWSENIKNGECIKTNTGIPQGYEASSVLANVYLTPVDDIMASNFKGICYYARYNDDIVLLFKDKKYINQVVDTISHKLIDLNLHINDKTTHSKIRSCAPLNSKKLVGQSEDKGKANFDQLLHIESKIPSIIEKISNHGFVTLSSKEVTSLRYYLRSGGFIPSQKDILSLAKIFRHSPPIAFHLSEFFIKHLKVKGLFLYLWKDFQKYYSHYTDWQRLCIISFFSFHSDVKKWNRDKKLLDFIKREKRWTIEGVSKFFQVVTSGTIDYEALLFEELENKKVSELQHILFGLLVVDQDLPKKLKHNNFLKHRSTLIRLVSHAINDISLTHRNSKKTLLDKDSIIESQLDRIETSSKETRETVKKLDGMLTNVLIEPKHVFPLTYKEEEDHLIIYFNNKPSNRPWLKTLHRTHVLQFFIDKASESSPPRPVSTYEEIWSYLVKKGEEAQMTKTPKPKTDSQVKSSMDRNMKAINKDLKDQFYSLRSKGKLYKNQQGYCFLTLPNN